MCAQSFVNVCWRNNMSQHVVFIHSWTLVLSWAKNSAIALVTAPFYAHRFIKFSFAVNFYIGSLLQGNISLHGWCCSLGLFSRELMGWLSNIWVSILLFRHMLHYEKLPGMLIHTMCIPNECTECWVCHYWNGYYISNIHPSICPSVHPVNSSRQLNGLSLMITAVLTSKTKVIYLSSSLDVGPWTKNKCWCYVKLRHIEMYYIL